MDIASFFNDAQALFFEMAPYLLLGFTVAGLLKLFVPDDLVVRYLGRGKIKSPLLAAVFGTPMPLCSCGVIPTGLSLYKRGASKGAAISFITSAPQTGVDNIAVTYGFLGWPMAVFTVISAFVTGVLGGIAANVLDPHDERGIQHDDHHDSHATFGQRTAEALRYSFYEMVVSLRRSLLLGLLVAAAITAFLPEDVISFIPFGEHRIVVYSAILLIALPMYVCALASIPIALGLIAAGFPAGAALIFLMAGPATNAATIGSVWKVLGRRSALIYLGNIILCSFAAAYLFDFLYPTYALTSAAHVHEHGGLPLWKYAAGLAMAGIFVASYIAPWLGKILAKKPEGTTLSLHIGGVTCNGCVSKIKNALNRDEVVESVELAVGGACVIALKRSDTADKERLGQTIKNLGYTLQEEHHHA